MIQHGKTLISEDILEKKFVCDLERCKGACCVEGASGAPLEKEETIILQEIYPKIRHYLPETGQKAIDEQGTSIVDSDGDHVTPLVDGKECAYTVFDELGVASCGIEKAHRDGVVDFRKPISCHLYPIRIDHYASFDAVNYHHWPICEAACALGEKLSVPTYRFTKDALIRKYGEKWYRELEVIAEAWEKEN